MTVKPARRLLLDIRHMIGGTDGAKPKVQTADNCTRRHLYLYTVIDSVHIERLECYVSDV